ncbi:MAG: 50S ribosomal protein L35 [bacterium]|nr:50S ribosomal protein L35 [bacterium]
MKNKQKTHKGVLKRFKITSTGKVIHRSHHTRHLKSSKSKRQIRSLNQPKQVVGLMARKIKKLLGIA